MSIVTFVKALFTKELSQIIAPLNKIHDQLETFKYKVADEIAAAEAEIKALTNTKALKADEQAAAAAIQTNLKTLLGKI